jgi:hypothetical protein
MASLAPFDVDLPALEFVAAVERLELEVDRDPSSPG